MKYRFGGYVQVGGNADNGSLDGFSRSCLAPLNKDGNTGWKASVVKASVTDEMGDTLADLELHQDVSAYFDEDGRLVSLSPVPWKEVN